jgi:hypothetical protein
MSFPKPSTGRSLRWVTTSSSQWEAEAATNRIPAAGLTKYAIKRPGIAAIRDPVTSEWEYGYEVNRIAFWSGLSGLTVTVSFPVSTRTGQSRSGKLTPVRITSGGTAGKCAMRR